MNVIDLTQEHQGLYFVCLKDWLHDPGQAGGLKKRWYEEMKDKGLRIKLALDNGGRVGGMIEYMPIEYAFAEGADLFFVNCIWVHGYSEGRGNFQGQGMGKSLLQAAEQDVARLGCKGLAVWGIAAPFWMSAEWYVRQGYQQVDVSEGNVLLWKPFGADAQPPHWIKAEYRQELVPGKVTVTSFINGQCGAENGLHERAGQVAAEFGDDVVFTTINTNSKDVMRKYGRKGGLYVDGANVYTGQPPALEELRQIIGGRVQQLR